MRVRFFFANPPSSTETYTLSLHDALPILRGRARQLQPGDDHDRPGDGRPHLHRAADLGDRGPRYRGGAARRALADARRPRSEEHTSELQSQSNLVCRLLLEKKKTNSCVLD